MPNEKPGSKSPLSIRGAMLLISVDQAAPLADGIQHGLESSLPFGIGHGFAYAGNGAAQGNLVGHFGMLARTCFCPHIRW